MSLSIRDGRVPRLSPAIAAAEVKCYEIVGQQARGAFRGDMEFTVDPGLPVALGVQLRGLIEYGVACGQLMPGDRLPSVREMATQARIAPMTVSQVYKQLQLAGLIEAQRGLGTFVGRNAAGFARPQLVALQRRIDELIKSAAAEGIDAADLARLFNARLHRLVTPTRAL